MRDPEHPASIRQISKKGAFARRKRKSDMTDEEIIELYECKDPSAIGRTQEKYGRYLHAIAQNILRDERDAEECENDAYLELWNAVPPARPDDLKAYLSKILRHLCLKKLRANRAQKRSTEALLSLEELEDCVPAGESVEDDLLFSELSASLDRFLRKLPAKERNIFILRYWYCTPLSEVACRFSCSEGKIKMILLRTRKKLKEYLKKEGVYFEK